VEWKGKLRRRGRKKRTKKYGKICVGQDGREKRGPNGSFPRGGIQTTFEKKKKGKGKKGISQQGGKEGRAVKAAKKEGAWEWDKPRDKLHRGIAQIDMVRK